MVTTAKKASELLQPPPIRRARGYRLYDGQGRRYLDLYLGGGRALLGHRPERTLLELKNLVSRGLLADFPSVFEHRLSKALGKLLPDHPVVRVFANEERLVSALHPFVAEPAVIHDPVIEDEDSDTPPGEPAVMRRTFIRRWRPFVLPRSAEQQTGGASILVPVLPFPGSFSPAVACISGVSESEIPPSDLVSPALLGALVRSVYDLVRFEERYGENRWVRFDAPWWKRRGPYLIATCENSEYSKLFRRLLEKGILINPTYPGPSIVPAEYTQGEIEPLRGIARDWKGG